MTFFNKDLDVEKGEQPDWKSSGYNVISELFITTKDPKETVRAENLATSVAKKYNAIYYDPLLDEYFRSEDL